MCQSRENKNTSWSQVRSHFRLFRATTSRRPMTPLPPLSSLAVAAPPPLSEHRPSRRRPPHPPAQQHRRRHRHCVLLLPPRPLNSLVVPSTARPCRRQPPLSTDRSGPSHIFVRRPALLLVVADPLPAPIGAVVRRDNDAGADDARRTSRRTSSHRTFVLDHVLI